MNFERLRWGEWIAAIAALDLLLVTFRAWYKVSGGDGRVTAWDGLEQGRYLLIATAIVGIFLLLMRAAEDTQQLSFPPGWIAAAVGLACTGYVAYRLATPPSDALDADIGLYLGLVSALGVAIGGLLSAREPATVVAEPRTSSEVAQDTFTGPTGAPSEPLGELIPDSGGTWSASGGGGTTGWSPAAPAAPAPPATVAGAAASSLQPGDSVVLTAGGARFPAGTVAQVVDVFTGGALVEVKAPDGMAERFEVPESAYERAPAGGGPAAAADEGWSPAMPAPATDDWGFDDDAVAEEKPAKQPWWKREIGGGKKKDEAAEVGAAGAVAAGAAAVEAETDGASEEKPGFFKRLFGGGGKDEPATETLEAESDTDVYETATESAVDDTPAAVSEPEPEVAAIDPEPEAAAPEPEVIVSEPEPPAPEPEPEPPAAEPEPEPEPPAPEPEPEPEPEPVAVEPDPEPEPAPDSEPEAAAPEPEVIVSDPEPPAPEPEPEPAAPEPEPGPEPAASAADEPVGEAAAAGASAAAAASAGDAEEQPKPTPKRKRSSGSRKVPKEAVAAGIDAPPKVGDEVQLKVGGGKYDAGTKGTVVDVFSAGVIVELSDDEGRTERLDLPFEAIGPADA